MKTKNTYKNNRDSNNPINQIIFEEYVSHNLIEAMETYAKRRKENESKEYK